MKEFDLNFHHLGLATDNYNLTLKILKKLSYKVKSVKIHKYYNVKNALCVSKTMPSVEIVSKSKKSHSPIDKIIKKNKQLVYHICYITKDFSKARKKLEQNKIHVMKISDSYLSPFEGIMSSFFFIKGLGIVEIMDERQKKRNK